MKLSIIRNSAKFPQLPWEIKQLQAAAHQAGLEFETVNIDSVSDLSGLAKTLGEIVIWRTASIKKFPEKSTAILQLNKNRVFFNNQLSVQPFLSDKLYQQNVIKTRTNLATIPTWHFLTVADFQQAIAQGVLTWPLIQKPRVAAQGEGISLLQDMADFNATDATIDNFIFQPFLKNNGDYRVFMVGGAVLGAIKRTAAAGHFLNNLAQGAKATNVTEPAVLHELTIMAGQIAAVTQLHLFGIDILLNEADGQFYFLEINTAPQWQGFEQTTGVPVATEIVKLGCELYNRPKVTPVAAITSYYHERAKYLELDKQKHWYGRTWLWMGDPVSKQWLADNRRAYIGTTPEETKTKITSFLQDTYLTKTESRNFAATRAPIFEHYPQLLVYNRLLFLTLFADTLYNTDVRPHVTAQLPATQLVSYREQLLANPEHVALLSTHAVNYLYLTQRYFTEALTPIDLAQTMLEIAQTAYAAKAGSEYVHLELYLLTHAIIGASNFYQSNESRSLLKRLIKKLPTGDHECSASE